MADQGVQAQGQGEGGGEAAEAQQGPDFQAVVEQLGSMAQGQEEMRQALAGLPELLQGQQQQGDNIGPDPQLLDPSMLDFENPAFDPNAAATSIQGWMEQQWQQREQQLLQQHVAPMQQMVQQMMQTGEARDLVAEFPELEDEETARQTVELAQQFAQDLGAPHLAANPKLWRAAYLMGRAMDTHMQEQNMQEGPQAAHLEGGGGAGPAGGSQPDLKQQILDSNRGSSVLPFG
jgi:hypothetical protein